MNSMCFEYKMSAFIICHYIKGQTSLVNNLEIAGVLHFCAFAFRFRNIYMDIAFSLGHWYILF